MTAAPPLAGRYRLVRPLGHGGMAVVELAEDVELHRTVAVKLLADNLARDQEVRRRFLREAQLAAALAHPNVVRVFDVGEDDGRPFLVMEHVEGETAADLLRREGPLPPDRAIELVVQACAGLQAAHDAGLVHRDVKPQNLLVRRDGVVKLVDFGIARASSAALTELTVAGTVLGTAGYVAPEQLEGRKVTSAADIYSLGAVLYELLAGRPPRSAQTLTDADLLAEPIASLRDLSRDVPAPLDATVMRCLARDPLTRPASAHELAQELLAPPSDAAATRPLPAAVPRPRRRRRTLLSLTVAAGLAAIGIGLVGLSSGGGGGAGSPPATAAPRVAAVPHSNDPAGEARNLATWLRRNSG